MGFRSKAQNMRLVAVGALVLVLTVGYLILLRNFNVAETPGERHFGVTGAIRPAAEIYIQPVSIDALNDEIEIRATVEPSLSVGGGELAGSGRDLTLVITHGNTVEEVKLAANEHLAAASFEVDLNEGSVTHYPLDSYRADLGVELFEAKSTSTDPTTPLPARITVWEGVLGFHLHTTQRLGAESGKVQLRLDITRGGAFALFALAAYGAMVVLGGCAFVIGLLTFVDVRRPEATLIGALAAIAFALPVLRNALPGAPPLGVHADMLVFLWTELVAVFSLALLVFKWARIGPRP
jgi:Domain of unknown function (DUF4436)